MSEKSLQRPVIVYYPRNVEPNERHPVGMLAGQTFECASPAVAEQYHPEATILRYADGAEYDQRAVNAEIRALAREQTVESTPTKPVKGASRAASGRKGSAGTKGHSKPPTVTKDMKAAVAQEIVDKAVDQQIAGAEPASVVDDYAARTDQTPDGTGTFPADGSESS
jgi:hypothetical protein